MLREHDKNREPISIHALREEGDQGDQLADPVVQDFYPRPPRGGRRSGAAHWEFPHRISIHALREEGDMVGPR